jgi:hypothetical protein
MNRIPPIFRTANFVAALLLLLSLLLLTRSAASSAVNLTTNWGFEDGFASNGVGLGWTSFVLQGNVTFANTVQYYWPGAEHTEGETSQLIISDDAFVAGLYQQINGVMPDTPYAAKAAMLTFFESPAPPTNDGTMQKLVGIDPYGGTNPDSPNVVWSSVDDHDESPWVDQRVAAVAQASTITLFVRVNCLYPVWDAGSLDNQAFIDAVMLAEAPTVNVSSPEISYQPSFTVTWDGAQAAPGGYVVKYDVEYKDDVNQVWTLWQDKTGATSALFSGESGRTYTFRARAYERYTDWHDVRLVGPWSEETSTAVYVIGGVEGHVRDNRDIPMVGATVGISGTVASTQTGGNGYYHLVPPLPGTYDVSTSYGKYKSPPEVRNVLLDEPVVELDFSLRPWDDVVSNGDFEEGLDGWATVAGSVAPPVVVSDVVRSGGCSLALGTDSPPVGSSGISQTVYITDTMYTPTLSFWYSTSPVDGGDGGDTFQVGIYHGDPWTYVPLLALEPSEQWAHTWLDVSAYLGSAWISLTYHREGTRDFVVYLDEVSLGRMSGGPNKAYLPLTLRNSPG